MSEEEYVTKEYEEWVNFCESESLRLVYDVMNYDRNNKSEKKLSESLSIAIFKDLLKRYKRDVVIHE